MRDPFLPPALSRHCRIGDHAGCDVSANNCTCRCHLPAELDWIAEEPAPGWPERQDLAADLEQALACLYALEARAMRAASELHGQASLRLALQEIAGVARTCLAALELDGGGSHE